MRLANLTPHRLVVHSDYQDTITLDPEGTVARVQTTSIKVEDGDPGCPDLYIQEVGEVEGLPDPDGETLWIVSTLVRTSVPDRHDVASPGELVRDDHGQPVGCRGLVVNR